MKTLHICILCMYATSLWKKKKTNVVGKHKTVLEGSFNLPIKTIFLDIHRPLQQWASLLSSQNNTNFNLTPLQHGRRKVERNSEHDRGFWKIPHACPMSNLQHPDCLPILPTCDFYSGRFLKMSIKQLYLMCSDFSGHSQFPGGEKTPGGVGCQPVTFTWAEFSKCP